MVHGQSYNVEYIIKLDREVDYFDDILPVSIDTRTLFKFTKNNTLKLVIINSSKFEIRKINKYFVEYMNCLDRVAYHDVHLNERAEFPDVFKYYDVKVYNNFIHFEKDVQPMPRQEFENLVSYAEELHKLYNAHMNNYKDEDELDYDNIRKKINSTENILMIQRIVNNPEYFSEIKDLYNKITDIELTDEEKELIHKVVTHPKLNGVIASHGFNLFDYYC
jgi:hypothetical protein